MTKSVKTISCIIPAYNEEQRISNVLKIVSIHPKIDEVIVVDDGSSDKTYDEAIKYESTKFKVIKHAKNRGKSEAFKTGFMMSTGEIILTLDSDLMGLNCQNIDTIINPLDHFDCMTLAYWKDFHLSIKLTGIPIWSGMRAIPRYLFEKALQYSDSGYVFESILNKVAIADSIPIYVETWDNVTHVRKTKKAGIVSGTKGYIKMYSEIFSETPIPEIMYQFMIMNISNRKTKKLLNKEMQ